ncbi:MAG TPA: gliding motility-associated C-terminal domain-containing protein [Saprospiraceae bacterium]|nr:gliding motility-associated C-terminal domain-containing protein [Saprospiraceae bacterium]
MENQAIWKMRRWLCFLAFCLSFSSTNLIAGSPFNFTPVTNQPSGSLPPVVFTFNCIDGEPGDTICVPVTVTGFVNIVIVQMEIIWDSDVLDFIEISNIALPNINTADFNHSGPNALKFIPLNLDLTNGETLPDGSTLFEVCFRIIGTPGSSSVVGVSPYFDFEVADIVSVIPSDSVSCTMNVTNAVDLVGFLTSCGPAILGDDGTMDLTVYGGTPGYTVTWTETISGTPGGPVIVPTEGGNTLINVPFGNYDVLVTDGLGNTVTYNTDVDTLGLSIVTRLKHPTCYKFENGTIRIIPVGGSAPYSYIWKSLSDPTKAGSGFIRNVGDSSLVTSLADGMYSILVKDDNGCEEEVIIELLDKPFIFTVNNLHDATCNGSADGFIDLTISGGTPDASLNYTISITPNFVVTSNAVTIGLLNPGRYCITVDDEVSQCDTVYCFDIGAMNIITANVSAFDAPCFGTNGNVSVRGLTNGVSGPMYTYTIYNHGVQETSVTDIVGIFNYSPLSPGDYMIIVEEGLCKSDSIPFTIGEPLPMTVSLSGSSLDNCVMNGIGAAWFEITNGMGPYILSAGSGVQDGDTLEKLNSGNYTLTVTDSKGCKANLPFTIHDYDDNEEADITFQIDGTPCDGGTVTVLYQGGNPPPGSGIVWSNDSITQTIPIVQGETLSVHILLGNPIFCFIDDTVILNCDKKLDIDITVIQPLCNDEAAGGPYTGTVIVDTVNAVAPVTWTWSIPDVTTTGIYAGLSPGKYYVTVTDALDSIAVDSFEIIAPDALHLTFGIPDSTSCPAACDGAVLVTPEDGDITMDYFLYWTTNTPHADTNFFFQVQNLCQGPIAFTVSQDGVCFYTDTVEILSPTPIDVDLAVATPVTCFGGDDGGLEVTASGGTPGYTFKWESGLMASTITDLSAGTYLVTVSDMYGCIQLDSFDVDEPDTLIAQIDSSGTKNLSCGSSNDGIIAIDVSGGNDGGYTFLWNPDVSNSYLAVNLTAGNYFITITDPKGCTDTTSYILTSPPPIVTIWPDIVPPECFGDETVLQINQVSGGSGNYSFNINGGELLNIGEPVLIPSGIYIVSVFDDRGCSDDTTYIVMEPNPILLSISPGDAIIELGDSLLITGHVEQSDNPVAMTLWSSTDPQVSCATCDETYVFNFLPTVYTWTVTDINGCQGTASITVGVDFDRDVFIPNIFSPNSDGRNDHFSIFTGPGVVSVNYLHIYDRWGNLVHSQTKMLPSSKGAGDWDGTYDGQPLSPGVYVYVAEIQFIDNETKLIYRGDITLVK